MVNLQRLFSAVALTGLAACGGGGGGTTATPVASAPAATPSPVTATPSPVTTTPIASPSSAGSQTEATAWAKEANAGLVPVAVAAAAAAIPRTPYVISVACSNLTTGGSGNLTVTGTSSLVTGSTYNQTFANCSVPGFTLNGLIALSFENYTSPTNFAFSANVSGVFTVTDVPNAQFNQLVIPAGSKLVCTTTNAIPNCVFNDNTRIWSSATYSSGTANGSYTIVDGTGVAKVTYANFTPFVSSGTATITTANGNTVVVVRTASSIYDVTITASNGTTKTKYTINL